MDAYGKVRSCLKRGAITYPTMRRPSQSQGTTIETAVPVRDLLFRDSRSMLAIGVLSEELGNWQMAGTSGV